jgi:IS5 family transposase
MLRNCDNRSDQFALVPELGLRFEPHLEQLDRLLEDDVLFEALRDDLAPGRKFPSAR